jgi:hypothetical protein
MEKIQNQKLDVKENKEENLRLFDEFANKYKESVDEMIKDIRNDLKKDLNE